MICVFGYKRKMRSLQNVVRYIVHNKILHVKQRLSPQRWVIFKNVAAILVVFSHCTKIMNIGIFNQTFDAGTYSVSLFLFLSGYGLTFSYQNKPNYLFKFLSQRFLKILIIYFVTTVFWIVIAKLLGMNVSWSIGGLLSIYPTLPYGWFFVVLMILYIIFYISFKFINSAILIIAFTVLWYIVGSIFHWGEWIYMSTPCFVVGVFIAFHKARIETWILSRKYCNLFIASLFFLITWRSNLLRLLGLPSSLQTLSGVIGCSISAIAFVYLLVSILVSFDLKKIEMFRLGDWSFEIYLSQCIILPIAFYLGKFYIENDSSIYNSVILIGIFTGIFFTMFVFRWIIKIISFLLKMI